MMGQSIVNRDHLISNNSTNHKLNYQLASV